MTIYLFSCSQLLLLKFSFTFFNYYTFKVVQNSGKRKSPKGNNSNNNMNLNDSHDHFLNTAWLSLLTYLYAMLPKILKQTSL